jgi:hypothetical protein
LAPAATFANLRLTKSQHHHQAVEHAIGQQALEQQDEVSPLPSQAVSLVGDLWLLGNHRLLCADARSEDACRLLLVNEQVDMIFADRPCNVPVDGHVCGLGRIRHREFAMGVGEMSAAKFSEFLGDTLKPGAHDRHYGCQP